MDEYLFDMQFFHFTQKLLSKFIKKHEDNFHNSFRFKEESGTRSVSVCLSGSSKEPRLIISETPAR